MDVQSGVLQNQPGQRVLPALPDDSQRHLHGLFKRDDMHGGDVQQRVCVERKFVRAAELRRRTIPERQFLRILPVGAVVRGRHGDIVSALFVNFRRQRQVYRLFRFGGLHSRFLQRRL